MMMSGRSTNQEAVLDEYVERLKDYSVSFWDLCYIFISCLSGERKGGMNWAMIGISKKVIWYVNLWHMLAPSTGAVQ